MLDQAVCLGRHDAMRRRHVALRVEREIRLGRLDRQRTPRSRSACSAADASRAAASGPAHGSWASSRSAKMRSTWS